MKGKRKGYGAFFVCGLCLLLSVLMQQFSGGLTSTAILLDILVSFVLTPLFIVSGSVGVIMAVQNREDVGLVLLAMLGCAFVALNYFNVPVAWRSHAVLIVLFGYR